MSYLARLIPIALALGIMSSLAMAETKNLSVSVSYRERVALPTDAELDVQLVGTPKAGGTTKRIASQRISMTRVPMTITLPYDGNVIDSEYQYTVVSSIWSSGERPFHKTQTVDVLDQTNPDAVDVQLMMVANENNPMPGMQSVAGIEWAVTEVKGEPWPKAEPATLMIDTLANVSVFAGCNHFRGRALLSDGALEFPENFAGTLMACPDDIEALERKFLRSLGEVSAYVRYGAGLVMTDAQGRAVLHFVERPG